ncbi:MAG: hypothetical protein EOO43_03895 [Flavobacterium sp.]|nr:MAG: hypothetical protein EOO43_03895 [Flavobacterium sp.]
MTKKKYIGQLVSIKYNDRPTPIFGFVIDYNDDWTLLKYNPVDYVIDGYIILRHKNIEGFRRDANEKFREKVIMLKKQHLPDISDFPLTDLETILSSLTKKYGIFQFDLKTEKSSYLGKLKSLTTSKLTIHYLNPKGLWTKQMQFRPNDIRTIEFDTDYINSLKLVSKRAKAKT